MRDIAYFLGGDPKFLSSIFQYDFSQFRLLAELLFKVYGFTCTKPLEFQQEVAEAVEEFLSAFPVRRIWWLTRTLEYRYGTKHYVPGSAPEDLVVDGTNALALVSLGLWLIRCSIPRAWRAGKGKS